MVEINNVTLADLEVVEVRRTVRTELATTLGDSFELLGSAERDLPLAMRHRASQIPFRFIPSGEFFMGLSHEEELAARKISDPIPANLDEMRPVTKVRVNAFLMSCIPTPIEVFEKLG